VGGKSSVYLGVSDARGSGMSGRAREKNELQMGALNRDESKMKKPRGNNKFLVSEAPHFQKDKEEAVRRDIIGAKTGRCIRRGRREGLHTRGRKQI